MAWRDYNKIGTRKSTLFNVTESVGWYSARTGAPAANRIDDMMLVAYFLNYYLRYGDRVRPNNPPLPNKQSELKTIPLPGLLQEMMKTDRKSTISNLSYWIKRYQQSANRGASNIYDGRVDLGLTINHTICVLNYDYMDIVKRCLGVTDWIDFMLNDNPTLMPPLLKNALSYDPEAIQH